jgi:hypothetical protein
LKGAMVRFAEITFTPLIAPEDSGSPEASTNHAEAKPPKLISDSSLPRPPAPVEDSMDDRWARAVEESNRVQQIAREGGYGLESDDVRPKVGDIVNHQQFGRCTVLRMGDDHITLRKPDKRSVPLGLTVLKFVKTGDESGRAVFRVEVRPKH